ncbi:MAG TPA: tRNA preQ1(34) S-adenosylmethionine ribosyltransferase-isomerase QueA [Nitrospiraceae bacterium]|nr:tRNA preQ1(34) S-adenosylmethionine ribosyltransferase-isomerase QueA [Nitrospiraceae bacterium]
MLLTEFDFPFDPSLIADRPVEPRDQARLLVVHRKSGSCSHHRITELPALMRAGDLIIVNDTKVMAVRMTGRKRPGGGRVELVLVREIGTDTWEVLLKGEVRPGQVIDLGCRAQATVVERSPSRTMLRIASSCPVRELIREIGQMPLPPYIKRSPMEADRVWYQTVFARAEGSIAAPTAGLHFTEGLLAALRERAIQIATITLHVGPGTFRPVKTERIQDHVMAAEWIEVAKETAEAVQRARATGGRIMAVGTTVVRALEAVAGADGLVQPVKGETELFIMPGYQFRVVDAMMTNFHLPRTTLVMLVAAFAGTERLREAYREAIRARYRFYSYGDAMLIV